MPITASFQPMRNQFFSLSVLLSLSLSFSLTHPFPHIYESILPFNSFLFLYHFVCLFLSLLFSLSVPLCLSVSFLAVYGCESIIVYLYISLSMYLCLSVRLYPFPPIKTMPKFKKQLTETVSGANPFFHP